jgi:hypothetical protein
MQVIHFTHGATEPLQDFGVIGAHFLRLADGERNSHIGCLHLETDAKVFIILTGPRRSLTLRPRPHYRDNHAARINIHAGMGAVFEKKEPYSLTSDPGAILLIVESDDLETHERAISTPQRIAGQSWPSDKIGSMT